MALRVQRERMNLSGGGFFPSAGVQQAVRLTVAGSEY